MANTIADLEKTPDTTGTISNNRKGAKEKKTVRLLDFSLVGTILDEREILGVIEISEKRFGRFKY